MGTSLIGVAVRCRLAGRTAGSVRANQAANDGLSLNPTQPWRNASAPAETRARAAGIRHRGLAHTTRRVGTVGAPPAAECDAGVHDPDTCAGMRRSPAGVL